MIKVKKEPSNPLSLQKGINHLPPLTHGLTKGGHYSGPVKSNPDINKNQIEQMSTFK